MNKTEQLIDHFESGGSITTAEARRMFGIQELRSTINRIQNEKGLKLKSVEEDGLPNAFSGKPLKVKRWSKA